MRRLLLMAAAAALVVPGFGVVMADLDTDPVPKNEMETHKRTTYLELDRKDSSDGGSGPIELPLPPISTPITGIDGGKGSTQFASSSGGAIPAGSGGPVVPRAARIERALKTVVDRLD